MQVDKQIVESHIEFFFSTIVGFTKVNLQYLRMNDEGNEFLSIAMDKIDRLTRKNGRLRDRVWNNCYFIFHGSETDPTKSYENKVSEIKGRFPYLFIRSYIYFVFIDISKVNELTIIEQSPRTISTSNYRIWMFNSKYEIVRTTSKKNLFNIKLNNNEAVDDYVYIAKTESELQRISSSNSDAIDCVRAFTGDLELLAQTSEMLESVRQEFSRNENARIILEGPARSGKTIIAATLLGEYKDSKFLLMNYFFYRAIVDGFHALSGWDKKEIEELVKNPELDRMIDLKSSVPRTLTKIRKNLEYAIDEVEKPRRDSKTKKWLEENIQILIDVTPI